jgi:curved DNA-binding protein CbpA
MTRIEAKKLLELADHFSLDELKTAFRKMAMKTHPDKGGSVQAFFKVQAAYQTLLEQGSGWTEEIWEESPEELKARLEDIAVAFDAVLIKFYDRLNLKTQELYGFLKISMDKFDSVSKIKNEWDGIVSNGWNDFAQSIHAGLLEDISEIAKNFDEWLTSEMRIAADFAKEQFLKKG